MDCVQKIIDNKMSIIVKNFKLSISSSKINLDVLKDFSLLKLDKEYTKSAFTFCTIFRILIRSISFFISLLNKRDFFKKREKKDNLVELYNNIVITQNKN